MSKPDYTEEELQKIPQTTKVFEHTPMQFNDHEWLQEGYMVRDVCNPSRMDCQNVGIPIPIGKMLIKNERGYELVNELRG